LNWPLIIRIKFINFSPWSEIPLSINCTLDGNGLVSKCLPKENSAKFIMTGYNKTSSLWVLATDYSNHLLTYQCSKHDVNGNIQIIGINNHSYHANYDWNMNFFVIFQMTIKSMVETKVFLSLICNICNI